ncbi:MAG: YceD family protein [Solirubrobacteraceae bacterium]
MAAERTQRRRHGFDLASLRLSSGEGRRLDLSTSIEPLVLGSETYGARALETGIEGVPVQLNVSRMTGGGYALLLRFSAEVLGPCMRCLKPAGPHVEVEAREVDRPGSGDELDSPYVHEETLDLAGWARDAFALAMPAKILCKEGCAGLCPVCAADLNDSDPAGPEHHHESEPDPRWAKLRELRLE